MQNQRIHPERMRQFIAVRSIMWKHLGDYVENAPIDINDAIVLSQLEFDINRAISEIIKDYDLISNGNYVTGCSFKHHNGQISIELT